MSGRKILTEIGGDKAPARFYICKILIGEIQG